MSAQRALRVADLPAIWYTLAAAMGTGSALFVPVSSAALWWASACAVIAATALLLVTRFRSVGALVAYAAISLIVCARAESAIGRDERRLLTDIESDTVIVSCRGVVVWKDLGRGTGKSERLWLSNPRVRIAEREFASDDLLLTLSLPLANSVNVEIGDAIAYDARLTPAHLNQIRSARDVTWTLRQRVWAETRLIDPEKLVLVPGNRGLRHVVHFARNIVQEVFASNLSPDAAAIAGALLLGSREAFAPEFNQDLQSNGLAHLFALSGLNTGLIVSLAWLLFGFAQLPARLRYLLLLLVLVGYAVLGLGVPSLFRSSLMAGLFIIGRLLARQTHPANLLLVAAGVELFCWPLHLLDAGFLLSYLSMAGILAAYVVLSEPLQELIGKRRSYGVNRRASEVLSSTAGAQLATAPVVALLFSRTPALAVLSNLVAIPLFSLLLVLILLFLAIHPLLPEVANPVAQAINGIAWLFTLVSKTTANLPAASFVSQGPPLLLVAGVGSQILGIVFFWRGALKRGALFSLLCLNILVWSPFFVTRAQAEAVAVGDERELLWLLRIGESCIVANCGPSWSAERSAQVIRTELSRARRSESDALLVFDRRASAIGGADVILSASKPKLVADLSASRESLASDLLDAALLLGKVESLALQTGDVLELPDTRIKVLWREPLGMSGSLIMVEHRASRVLFAYGSMESVPSGLIHGARRAGDQLIIPMDALATRSISKIAFGAAIASEEPGVRWRLRGNRWMRIESTGKQLMRVWSLPGVSDA